MLVAPASSAFSTSSLTAVERSRMTWPEQMRCTALLSIGLITPGAGAGRGADIMLFELGLAEVAHLALLGAEGF